MISRRRSTVDHPGFLREIWDYRFALLNLVLKDFRIRYRNMSLGILWSVLNPLVMLGVLVFIFTYVFPNRTVAHFPVFILTGLIFFNFFSLCISSTTNALVENAPLVKKTIFPRILLPLSVVLSQIIHLIIQLGLLTFFIILFKVPVTAHYLWLPPILLILLLYTTGLALALSLLNVYYRDMLYIVQSTLTLLFWFTPVFYSLTTVHQSLPRPLYAVYILNPLSGCIDGARKAILDARPPDTIAILIATAIALLTLVAGTTLYIRYQRNLADKL